MSGDDHHEVSAGPQVLLRSRELVPIVLDVLQHVDVEDAVESAVRFEVLDRVAADGP